MSADTPITLSDTGPPALCAQTADPLTSLRSLEIPQRNVLVRQLLLGSITCPLSKVQS